MRQHKALKTILWIVAIYHCTLGLVGIFLKSSLETIARTAFRFNLILDPQTTWIINPLAAYVLAFGLMAGIAATNPVKHRPMIWVVVVLCAVRVAQRAVFMLTAPADLQAVASPTQNIAHLSFVAVLALLIAALAVKLSGESASHSA